MLAPVDVENMELSDTQGVLCVLDRTGDTKLVWDRTNDDEIENARNTFRNLKAKGFIAYTVKKNGEKGEVIRDFDPDAEKIIMAQPLGADVLMVTHSDGKGNECLGDGTMLVLGERSYEWIEQIGENEDAAESFCEDDLLCVHVGDRFRISASNGAPPNPTLTALTPGFMYFDGRWCTPAVRVAFGRTEAK